MNKEKHRPRGEILPIASHVEGWLEANGITSCICGSLRRKTFEVDYVDLAVESGNLFDVANCIAVLCSGEMGCELESTVKLESKKTAMIIGGVRFNIYRARKDEWGAMLLALTGNYLFTRLIRARAKSLDMKLNQYGLFHGDEIIAGKTEEQIFAALGMPYVRPEDREYTGGMYLPQL